MAKSNRVFILGAGFSKPAGMPLATELLPFLTEEAKYEDMQHWLSSLSEQLAWLSEGDSQAGTFKLNIEEAFHYAQFCIEVQRLRQHRASVGRRDGSGTPWNQGKRIEKYLSELEYTLRDVILQKDNQSDLAPIKRWAEIVDDADTVLTFNYDTLVERALTELGKKWNHATGQGCDSGIAVCKLHGSIDWIVGSSTMPLNNCDLLFRKTNTNRRGRNTGNFEDDYCLWQCRTREQLRSWILDRDLQFVGNGELPSDVGIAGLGAYKQLHKIPGLGQVWANGMKSALSADVAVVIGFSMSDFDVMAQMQFAEVAQKRHAAGRPLRVIVIDPCIDEATKNRFRRVFRSVEFVSRTHETVDWSRF